MPRRPHSERRASGHDVLSTLRGGTIDGADAAAATEARLGALGSYVVDFALGDVWTRPGLSRRDRSLIVITMLTTLNQLNQLRGHVDGGLNHGLTRTEVEEVFVQLAGYAGFPRAIDGMTVASEVFGERLGSDELPPSAPAEYKEDDRRSADARSVMDRMGDFTGDAGRFAFGDLWSRDQISRRDRSLVVCSTLVTQDKPTELRFHLQAALNHGVTLDELRELMITAIVYVGFPTGVEGFRSLAEVESRQ